MRLKKISTKLFLITFIGIFLTSIAILLPMIRDMGQIIDHLTLQDTESSIYTIERVMDGLHNTATAASHLISTQTLVESAVFAQNMALLPERVNDVLSTVKNFSDLDLLVITNASGVVLFRLHSDVIGDDISYRPDVARALEGESSTSFHFDAEAPISILSSTPIYFHMATERTRAGVVIVGYDLTTTNFVDNLKDSTGTEISLFSGRYNVMTTITNPGSSTRNLGEPMLERFHSSVSNGMDYHGRMTISGEDFIAFYRPLRDSNGEVAGAFFSGQSLSYANSMRNSARNFAIIIAAIAVILILGLATLLNQKMIVKPVKRTTDSLELLSKGQLSSNMWWHHSEDEIGKLSRSTVKTVNVICSVMDDLEKLMKLRADGDTSSRFDEFKYEGDFSHLVHQFNQMFDEEDKINKVILNAIKSFSDGDFYLEIPQFAGNRAVFHHSLEDLKFNLADISKQTQELLAHALDGNLDKRANHSIVNGDWSEILKNMNRLMEAVSTPIDEATRVLGYMTRGDFSQKMLGNYKGVFNNIKTSVNTTEATLAAYVREISNILIEMSHDNFAQEINTDFKGDFARIKVALNDLMDKFSSIISSISDMAGEVLEGARQLSSSSGNLADGSNAQAATVEELSVSTELVTARIHEDFETTQAVGKVASNNKTSVALGNEHMQDTLIAMESISEVSGSIASILSTINGIAHQTNLLALNAAVEAASAGTHGKGFKVVADEVKTLAGRSKMAAQESSELINDALERIKEGQRAAQETAKTFEEILANTNEVDSLVSSIEQQSQKQQEALSHISIGIKQIADVAQQNTSISEAVASSATGLSDRAETMDNMVKIYKIRD